MPSAAGAAAFAAAGLFVGAGVTRSPGGAAVAVAFADAAGAFVAVTAGVGVSNHPGGYVPPPPVGTEPTSPKVLLGSFGACTLSLMQTVESVPVPDAFHAHTVMFTHLLGLTAVYADVFVVPLCQLPFMLMLYESVTLQPMSKTAGVDLSLTSGRPLAITLSHCHEEPAQL
jgi:hypothetical protein